MIQQITLVGYDSEYGIPNMISRDMMGDPMVGRGGKLMPWIYKKLDRILKKMPFIQNKYFATP